MKMHRPTRPWKTTSALTSIAAVTLAWTLNAQAQEDTPWWDWASDYWDRTAKEWLSPHLYLTYAVGESSGDPAKLAVGHHDPTREDGTVQGLELGLSLRANEYIHGFATYNLSYGIEKEWAGEWEEAFIKLLYPDIAQLRGGRMLTRFGDFNAKHLHAWDTVDMPLVIGRFLGDDGLILDGADVTGSVVTGYLTTSLILGYGNRPSHEEHRHGEVDDEDEHGHIHAGNEALPQDDVGTARLFFRYLPSDFWRYVFGFSGAVGNTEEGLDSGVLGADFSLAWRENGLEAGGRGLRWTTEVLYREFDGETPHAAHDEEHEHHTDHAEEPGGIRTYDETGLYSTLIYTHNVHFDAGLRMGWVQGVEELELDERLRVSPLATYWVDDKRQVQARLQYNYDELEESEEHSVWLQLQAAFGAGNEVR